MSSRRQSYQSVLDERDKAHRLYKRVKNDIVQPEEFDADDWGLLYLYYPEVLPDVDPEVRGS